MNKIERFSVLVIGENPDNIIRKYDSSVECETPYIIYKYEDRKNIRATKIKIYEQLIGTYENERNKQLLIDEFEKIKQMTDDEYYATLLGSNELDSDNNIITTENRNGKFQSYEMGGKIYSKYIVNNDGNYTCSCKKNKIGWHILHRNKEKVKIYEKTWDLCVNNVKPIGSLEQKMFDNMSKYNGYFNNFKSKEEYVLVSTSFFTNAIIFEDKWFDMENENQTDWICNFYDRFIEKIKNEELITIYECTNF